jgi:hypothetical protein
MAHPAYIQKTLVMKPEVNKIFIDLEEWLDHCRMELIEFRPADLYKSKEYKSFVKEKNKTEKYGHRPVKYKRDSKNA